MNEEWAVTIAMFVIMITLAFSIYLALSNNNMDILWVMSEQGDF